LESDRWSIGCRSLIGSVTWNLIPPLTQLVLPRLQECVGMLEFFELVFDAVLRGDAPTQEAARPVKAAF
jgi:hypothetical protein